MDAAAETQSVPAMTFSRPTSSANVMNAIGDQFRMLDEVGRASGSDTINPHAQSQFLSLDS